MSNNQNITNPMLSSVEIEKINNNKIKKILSKNEIEDIEKCLISMSEEGTGRYDNSSIFSDKKQNEYPNNNVKGNNDLNPNKINIAKENFKLINIKNISNLEKNPNLVFSNKNFGFKNLKSANDLKTNKNNSRNNSKKQNFINTNNINMVNSGKYGVKGKKDCNSIAGKFNNGNFINIDNQSGYESNNSVLNSQNQTALDILRSLPNKIFIDGDEYNKLKYKSQADIRIDEMVRFY